MEAFEGVKQILGLGLEAKDSSFIEMECIATI